MIVNDLTYTELSELIGSFLSLKRKDEILRVLSHFYDQEINSRDDVYNQTRIKLLYKGFSFRFPHMRQSNSGYLSFILEFKKRQGILDKMFGRATRELVDDLENICKNNIHDIEFSCLSHTEQYENCTIVYHYPKDALNEDWQAGYDISPLLIAPDAHHGNCFVEFLFNSACFRKTESGFVSLSPKWQTNIYNLSQGIKEDSQKLLNEIL
jgi:hypothetical protein